MADTPELDFKGKLGPLPVWLWGAIAAGVVLIGYFIYRRSGAGTVVTGANLDAAGYQTAGIKGGTAEAPVTLPESNLSWLDRVSRQVAAMKSLSPTAVYAALYKWITGQALSAQEKSWVDDAIRIAGNPPEGTQGLSEVTPNTPNAPVVVNPSDPYDYPFGAGRYAVRAYPAGLQYVFDPGSGKIVRMITPAENVTLRAAGNNYRVDTIGIDKLTALLKASGLPVKLL